jgi:hypothetical protein
MAKLMNNRTDNDIKNKWYSMMRKEQNAQQKQAQKQPKTQRERCFVMDLPLAQIGNETDYDNVAYNESSQLNTGPRPSDTFFLAAFSQGWSFPNLSGPDYSAFHNPHFATESPVSFAMIADGAASQSVIPCNGTTGAVVMEAHPMTMETRGTEPSRSANFGVPIPSVTTGQGMAMLEPSRADPGLMPNNNMSTTEVGCTPLKIGVKRFAPI